jgi:site-specific DNA-methyltransferase (adenine-specific)
MRKEIIGDATLYLGDCMEVLPTLGRVDCVITDPPYEIPGNFGTSDLYGSRRMEFHFDTVGVTEEVVIPALSIAFELAEAFHVFCGCEQFAGIAKAARMRGFTPKPWAKQKLCSPPPMPGNWWPSSFELAMYGYKPGAYFGDTSGTRKNMMVFDSYRHGIRAAEKENHPTQKWLPMVAYLVQTICRPDGSVLDPFMGSGTTGAAATQLGRKFIGIEREPKYFDIACRRIEQAAKQGQLFAPEPQKQVQESLIGGEPV